MRCCVDCVKGNGASVCGRDYLPTCGVPRRSIKGTRCSAVYLASNRFILASNRSPSTHRKEAGLRQVSHTGPRSSSPHHVNFQINTHTPSYPPMTYIHLYFSTTFHVNSGENVLEWCSMQQVTHFLLRLQRNGTNKTFKSTNTSSCAVSQVTSV